MELIKYQAGSVLPHIRHNMRDLPEGKTAGNDAIVPELKEKNYSLIKRGKNAAEVNQYRHDLEREIFRYKKRKNVVRAVEVVIQCPSDCPPEQKEAFFKESYQYICSTLPMGERCVFLAEIHADERYVDPSGTMISKDHLHIMYVPAVPDKKHPGFQYKLCADQLTKKSNLNALHPGLQKHLDSAGIQATVYRKKGSTGKSIPLTVSQMKNLTEKTGITFESGLTLESLIQILQTNKMQEKQLAELTKEIEALRSAERSTESVWSSDRGWGNVSDSGWGNKNKDKEVEV